MKISPLGLNIGVLDINLVISGLKKITEVQRKAKESHAYYRYCGFHNSDGRPSTAHVASIPNGNTSNGGQNHLIDVKLYWHHLQWRASRNGPAFVLKLY